MTDSQNNTSSDLSQNGRDETADKAASEQGYSQDTQPLGNASQGYSQDTQPLQTNYQQTSYSYDTQPLQTDYQQAAGVQQQTYTQPQQAYQPPSQYACGQTVQSSSNQTSRGSADGFSPAPVQKKSSGAKTFGLAFLGAALACALGLGGYALATGNNSDATAASDTGSASDTSSSTELGASVSSPVNAPDTDASLAEVVAEKCLPSVVSVYVYTDTSSYYNYYGFGYGYGGSDTGSSDSSSLTQSALGSGVIITDDGYILTNYHVIEDAAALKVNVSGEEYDAEVIGYDSSSDVAVIKAQDAENLVAIEIGDSDDLTVGEWVMTIGSPYGYEQSVATGIVSATSRSEIYSDSSSGDYTYYTNMIQTDAAINTGNSGGALVDADGKLIGINTLITSSSGSYSGVGFAIPVNYAISIAKQLVNGETPTHALLGVSLTSVTSSVAQRYGLGSDTGAYVSAVTAGSGAEAAGIEIGDIITAFDGETVESASDLILDVREKAPGDTVSVTVNRSGETMDFQVTLGSDAETQTSASSATEEEIPETDSSSSSSSDFSDIFEYLFGEGSGGYGYGNSSGSRP